MGLSAGAAERSQGLRVVPGAYWLFTNRLGVRILVPDMNR
jgi:hypothetical protein